VTHVVRKSLANPEFLDYYAAAMSTRTLLPALLLILASAMAAPVEPGLPSQSNSLLKKGNDEYLAGKYQDAARDFAQAVKESHDTCRACLEGLALSKARLGDAGGSLKLADKAISLAATPEEKASAHNCRGEICLMYADADPKRLSEAESEYRTVSQLLPGHAATQFRLGYVLLREKKVDEGVAVLNNFVTAHPAGPEAELAKKLIARPAHAPFQFAPAFNFTTVHGVAIDSSALQGKVVVFDFWATWCPSCRASVPELRELSKRYPADKLVIVSISEDAKAADWSDFIERKHMDWNQYLDENGKTAKAFDIHAFPTYIIMDTDGAIVQRIVGMNPQQTLVHRLRDELAPRMR
jgi:thiol-disulfide isomerase/thioredoxin